MEKHRKHKPSRVRPQPSAAPEPQEEDESLEWGSLFKAFREAFDWALDVAAALARDFPEEIDAVERVRTFMRARLAGQPAIVAVDDVLFTFGLLIGAIEHDLGTLNPLGPWFAPPQRMEFPTAPERAPRVPRIVLARPPWSRGAFTPFVA